MTRLINKLIKRLILWAFRNRVVVLRRVDSIPDIELAQSDYPIVNYITDRVAHEFATKLVEEGIIDIRREYDPELCQELFRSRLYCLRLHKKETT